MSFSGFRGMYLGHFLGFGIFFFFFQPFWRLKMILAILNILEYFGHLKGFKEILVILEVSRVFSSICGYRGSMVVFEIL